MVRPEKLLVHTIDDIACGPLHAGALGLDRGEKRRGQRRRRLDLAFRSQFADLVRKHVRVDRVKGIGLDHDVVAAAAALHVQKVAKRIGDGSRANQGKDDQAEHGQRGSGAALGSHWIGDGYPRHRQQPAKAAQ